MEDAVAAREEAERAGAALRASEERYRTLFNTLIEGFCVIEVLFDADGRANDYRFLEVNPAFEAQTGLHDAEGKRMRELAPDHEAHWFELYGKVALTGEPARFVNEARALDCWFDVSAYRVGEPERRKVAILFNDITKRNRAEEALRKSTEELERSNKDLAQFAAVASHDLQEPLRTVSGFLQLLEKDYGDRLDEKAKSYVGYAVDGVKRMETLIRDLLAYARVGTGGREPSPTDASAALGQALDNLLATIRETGAEITQGELPTVRVDAPQLVQLFQNLLGNAIKFRGPAPPKVHVDACRDGDGWQFSVRDNGIGIDAKFQTQIFDIFRRLHTRKQYDGTGVGLAVCKRIVDRHGGRIWVESQPGEGATFHFTLPT